MSFPHALWRKIRHLALRYGWKPSGAKISEGIEVADTSKIIIGENGYDENNWFYYRDPVHEIPPLHPLAFCSDVLLYCMDGVINSYSLHSKVSKADAAAMAAALERALPHLPEGPEDFIHHKPGALMNPTEWLPNPNNVFLQDFISFCKGGGFRITP